MKKYLFISLLLIGSVSEASTTEGKIEMVQAGHGYTSENVYLLVKLDLSLIHI